MKKFKSYLNIDESIPGSVAGNPKKAKPQLYKKCSECGAKIKIGKKYCSPCSYDIRSKQNRKY